ncbi:MAG: N-acetylmuramic acid 6-phosphate etherase [Chloroflexi bacterium]|jgi:N-acetylmuramic acid 6-phosphate etherase|nr:N-acetylmuramic acid 6-phosphate etherase [Chloroflexota bacterium]
MADNAPPEATPNQPQLEAVDTISLATEASNPASRNLDQLSVLEIVSLMNAEDTKVPEAVSKVLPQIARAVEVITERMQRGGRLIYMGAGTSGRLGVLDAAECPPTFNTSPDKVLGLLAGGPNAMVNAAEAAEDDPELGRQDVIKINLSANDAVVGLAASGRTPYVIGALQYAREVGAAAIAVTCNSPSALEEVAEITIAPVTGPEVLAGSTRLKAGSAQKMVLNMLSTATMVRLGKTYGNLMVDMRPTNAKLRRRAARIVAEATGQDDNSAMEALEQSGGETRTAIVALLAGVTPVEARERLRQAGGFVRKAIQQ